MSEFEPPQVDGILPPVPQVTIYEVIRLDRLGFSDTAIAATLKLSVMDVQHALRKVAQMRALSEFMHR